MQAVMGRRPRAARSGKFMASTPAEKEMGVAIAEDPAEAPHQLDRQHVQRRAREVHLPLGGREEAPVVLDDERVGELHPEAAPERGRLLAQAAHQPGHAVPGGVPLEGGVRDGEVAVAQAVVEDGPQLARPEQRGVELHDDVEPQLLQQEGGDALDLVGRAAVEGGEGERVGDAGREGQLAEAGPASRDLAPQPVDQRRGVPHPGQEPAHPLRADAGQVVADAHVEDGVREPGRHAGGLQDLDQHGGLDVFLERLGQRELLRPLDVEAHRLHVDAGAGDVELVLDLDRLQLHEAAARQPRQHDVLGELGVRSRGRAERRRRAAAVDRHRPVPAGVAAHEGAGRQVEDRPALLQLPQEARDQHTERDGDERSQRVLACRRVRIRPHAGPLGGYGRAGWPRASRCGAVVYRDGPGVAAWCSSAFLRPGAGSFTARAPGGAGYEARRSGSRMGG